MSACLRSNEGIPEDCVKDKQGNEKDMRDQSIKIQDAVEDMKKWKKGQHGQPPG